MCRSPWETAPSLTTDHVQTKDKIYLLEKRVGESRNEYSASCVSGAQETTVRSRQQKHSQIIKVMKKPKPKPNHNFI